MLRRTAQFLFSLSLATAVTGCLNVDNGNTVTVSINVDSTQQVSASQGNFNGALLAGDRFGSAIATIGDLEADGVVDLAVGSPGDDAGGTDRGAVWLLFMNSDGTVDTETKIFSGDGDFNGTLDDGDGFGSAVGGIGDLSGDTILDIAVGAPGDDDGGTDQGAVWNLFLRQDGTVLNEAKISAIDGNFGGNLDDGDRFGSSLTVLGDLDGDGIADLAVGAPGDEDNNTVLDTGAIWILFLNRDGTVRSAQKISYDNGGLNTRLRSGDAFGSAVANIGDLNQDGVTDIAVGAPGDDDGGTDTGAVWILFLASNGRVINEQKLSALAGDFNGDIGAGDALGTSLVGTGDFDGDGIGDLLAGAPGDDDGGIDSGALWLLFMKRDGKTGDLQKLSRLEGLLDIALANGDRFGSSVAVVGNLDGNLGTDIVAGAPLNDDGATDTGSFWVLFMNNADTSTACQRNALLGFLGIGNCN